MLTMIGTVVIKNTIYIDNIEELVTSIVQTVGNISCKISISSEKSQQELSVDPPSLISESL